jgi:hypothetical protein
MGILVNVMKHKDKVFYFISCVCTMALLAACAVLHSEETAEFTPTLPAANSSPIGETPTLSLTTLATQRSTIPADPVITLPDDTPTLKATHTQVLPEAAKMTTPVLGQSWWKTLSAYAFRSAGSEFARLAVKDLVNGTVAEIPNTQDCNFPSWSPDGERIAYDISGRELYFGSVQNGETVFSMQPPHSIAIKRWIVVPYPIKFGDTYLITEAGVDLNLRDTASLNGVILKKLQPGSIVTILEGPVQVDGYPWWKMRTSDSLEGWAVNIPEWYAAVDLPIAKATRTPNHPQVTITPTP